MPTSTPRPRTFRLPLLALLLGPAFAFGAPDAAPAQTVEQEQAARVGGDALRVFLDCASRNCNREQFRREITFVNWVRQPQDAQVHVIMTSQGAGGGGVRYSFDFVGREELDGLEDELTYTSSTTDVQDEVIESLTRTLSLGLVRFAALAGFADRLEVRAVDRPAGGVQGEQITPEDDPWDFWVFSVSGDARIEAEDIRDSREIGFEVEANRTTEDWKINVQGNGDFLREDFELEDTTVTNDQDEWGASAFAVRSLGDHWGVGAEVEADRSTQLNRELLLAAGTGVEWNYFPYRESNRRELIARYVVSAERVEYQDTTLFDLLEETIWVHSLTLTYDTRATWGNADLTVGGSQFIDRSDFYSIRFEGGLNYRIVRGLSLQLNGEYSLVRDQIYLPKEELSDEDILLGRRRLPTDSELELRVGLRFSFGSIFNNVVNPRFGFGVR